MVDQATISVIDQALADIKSDDQTAIDRLEEALGLTQSGDVIETGYIDRSVGVAIGRNIKQVIIQQQLAPEFEAKLNRVLEALAASLESEAPEAEKQILPRFEPVDQSERIRRRWASSTLFISYSHDDLFTVQTIARRLSEEYFYDIWIDYDDIPGGSRWRDEITRGIDEADALVFMFSPTSLRSHWCGEEIGYAQERGLPIIPLRISGGVDARKLGDLDLADTQYVDFAGSVADWGKFLAALPKIPFIRRYARQAAIGLVVLAVALGAYGIRFGKPAPNVTVPLPVAVVAGANCEGAATDLERKLDEAARIDLVEYDPANTDQLQITVDCGESEREITVRFPAKPAYAIPYLYEPAELQVEIDPVHADAFAVAAVSYASGDYQEAYERLRDSEDRPGRHPNENYLEALASFHLINVKGRRIEWSFVHDEYDRLINQLEESAADDKLLAQAYAGRALSYVEATQATGDDPVREDCREIARNDFAEAIRREPDRALWWAVGAYTMLECPLDAGTPQQAMPISEADVTEACPAYGSAETEYGFLTSARIAEACLQTSESPHPLEQAAVRMMLAEVLTNRTDPGDRDIPRARNLIDEAIDIAPYLPEVHRVDSCVISQERNQFAGLPAYWKFMRTLPPAWRRIEALNRPLHYCWL
jgi:hypothetical protein